MNIILPKNHLNLKGLLKARLAAFSLVEVAIALVVLGILLGAALKGQELVESARQKAVLAQIATLEAAVATFQDRYGALPGDLPNASSKITAGLSNGRGEGSLQGDPRSTQTSAGAFWTHLAGAGLFEAGPIQGGRLSASQGLPSTRLGGVLTVAPRAPSRKGLWLLLSGENGQPILTPAQAQALDTQGDDGSPLSGRIQAETASEAQAPCIQEGHYVPSTKEPVCWIYFKIA